MCTPNVLLYFMSRNVSQVISLIIRQVQVKAPKNVAIDCIYNGLQVQNARHLTLLPGSELYCRYVLISYA